MYNIYIYIQYHIIIGIPVYHVYLIVFIYIYMYVHIYSTHDLYHDQITLNRFKPLGCAVLWVVLGVHAGQELLEVPQRQLLRELLREKRIGTMQQKKRSKHFLVKCLLDLLKS